MSITGPDPIYNAETGPTFMTGIQALVRLPIMQQLDRSRGLSTAGQVSGYRGPPLGAYDQQLWKAQKHPAAHDIVFQPGLNEDLAATALWGAQMHKAYGIALSNLEARRIGIAAQAVGMAQAAMAIAVDYARVRRSFG